MVNLKIHEPNSEIYKFRSKVRNYLATTFLATSLAITILWIVASLPICVILGAHRAVFGPKTAKTAPKPKDKNEDSGISAENSENSEASDDENHPVWPKFDFEPVSEKLKMLKFAENLADQILEYLAQCQLTPVLVTLRDVALLTATESTLENTVRIQYKKRKLKVMAIATQSIFEILKNCEHSDGSSILIYFLTENDWKSTENVEKLAENRVFVHEIKEMMGGEEHLEHSTMEFLMIKKEGIIWVNSKF